MKTNATSGLAELMCLTTPFSHCRFFSYSSMKLLTSLPPEILLLIAENLVAHDLVQMARTCRALKHLSDCKRIAKALLRHGTAENAINTLQDSVKRMDLIIELYHHVKNRSAKYYAVACVAVRLNDVNQLKAWHDEFGYIPCPIPLGAAKTDQVDTFEFLLPHIALGEIDNVFAEIGMCGNRVLLDHLRKYHPDMATPRRIVEAVRYMALKGRFDFALDVFESLPPHDDELIVNCAFEIALKAAAYNNIAMFTQFINTFQFDQERRSEIALAAAAHNRVDILRVQNESANRAESLEFALRTAVIHSASDVVRYIMIHAQQVPNRISDNDVINAFLLAITWYRHDVVQILMTHVPNEYLLKGAVLSFSYSESLTLLKLFDPDLKPKQSMIDLDNCDIYCRQDWKVTILLIVRATEMIDFQNMPYELQFGEALYQGALHDAVNLARELGFRQHYIDRMISIANEEK